MGLFTKNAVSHFDALEQADTLCPNKSHLITESEILSKPGWRPSACLPLSRLGPRSPLSVITNRSSSKMLPDLIFFSFFNHPPALPEHLGAPQGSPLPSPCSRCGATSMKATGERAKKTAPQPRSITRNSSRLPEKPFGAKTEILLLAFFLPML